MKIALVSTTVLPSKPSRTFNQYGGLERCAGDIATGLAARGHQVTLFAAQGSEAPGCEVVQHQAMIPEEQAYQQYRARLAEFEVVEDHTWEHWPIVSVMNGELPNTKVVICHHGVLAGIGSPPPVYNPLWLCFSAAQANYVSMTFGISTRFVYHGVDTDLYKPSAAPGKGGYYLILSRLSQEKGVLEAVKMLKKAKKRVVIIGDDKLIANQQYSQLVKAECDGYNAQFLPNQPLESVLSHLQGAIALVHAPLAPWIEIFGLVCAEAGASGIPVLGTRNGALPEIVEHGVTGYLADTTAGLAQYLDAVEAGTIQAEACRKRIEEKFSLATMVTGHEKLLQEVAAGNQW